MKAVQIRLHRLQLIMLLPRVADTLARRHPPAQCFEAGRTRRIGRAENRIIHDNRAFIRLFALIACPGAAQHRLST